MPQQSYLEGKVLLDGPHLLASICSSAYLPLKIYCIFRRISSEDVRLMLWDTAGQEEFDAITKAYYRGAQACVIVFSTTDRASFEAVKKWKKKVEDECGGGVNSIPMVLVQNKIDLMHQSVVSA